MSLTTPTISHPYLQAVKNLSDENKEKILKKDLQSFFPRREYSLSQSPENTQRKVLDQLLEKRRLHDLKIFIQALQGGNKWLEKLPNNLSLVQLKNQLKVFLKNTPKPHSLNLSDSTIRFLPPELPLYFPRLYELRAENCYFLLGFEFEGIWEVEVLSLRNSAIPCFPKNLKIPLLRVLSLSESHFTHFEPDARFPLLERLYLEGTLELQNTPSVHNVPNLECIELKYSLQEHSPASRALKAACYTLSIAKTFLGYDSEEERLSKDFTESSPCCSEDDSEYSCFKELPVKWGGVYRSSNDDWD